MLFGDRLRAAAVESITERRECGFGAVTACFSYQGHLLLQLVQVPVLLLPLPSILGTALEEKREITTQWVLSVQTSTEWKWKQAHACCHIVPSHLHSRPRVTTISVNTMDFVSAGSFQSPGTIGKLFAEYGGESVFFS